ncbi:MAG: T9SS type A sorting domain-containing protein, partial [Chitinophagales bacterium]
KLVIGLGNGENSIIEVCDAENAWRLEVKDTWILSGKAEDIVLTNAEIRPQQRNMDEEEENMVGFFSDVPQDGKLSIIIDKNWITGSKAFVNARIHGQEIGSDTRTTITTYLEENPLNCANIFADLIRTAIESHSTHPLMIETEVTPIETGAKITISMQNGTPIENGNISIIIKEKSPFYFNGFAQEQFNGASELEIKDNNLMVTSLEKEREYGLTTYWGESEGNTITFGAEFNAEELPVGAYRNWSNNGTVEGIANQPLNTLGVKVVEKDGEKGLELSHGFQANTNNVKVEVFKDGEEQASLVNDNGGVSPIFFCWWCNFRCDIKEFIVEDAIAKTGKKQLTTTFELPEVMTFELEDGTVVEGDEIRFIGQTNAYVTAVTHSEIVAQGVPQFEVMAQKARKWGNLHSGGENTVLDIQENELHATIDGDVAIPAEYNVKIQLDKLKAFQVNLAPIGYEPNDPFKSLDFVAKATINGEADKKVGRVELLADGNGGFGIRVEDSDLDVNNLRANLFLEDEEVQSISIPWNGDGAGGCLPKILPHLIGVSTTQLSEVNTPTPENPFFVLGFENATDVVLPNGNTVQADLILIALETNDKVKKLSKFDIGVVNLTDFAIINEQGFEEEECTYAVQNRTTSCDTESFTICIDAVEPIEGGIGIDLLPISHPEGMVATDVIYGDVLLNAVGGDGSMVGNIMNNAVAGQTSISLFFNNSAPVEARFEGAGNLICIEYEFADDYNGQWTIGDVGVDIVETRANEDLSVTEVLEQCAESGTLTVSQIAGYEGQFLVNNDVNKLLGASVQFNSCHEEELALGSTDGTGHYELEFEPTAPDANMTGEIGNPQSDACMSYHIGNVGLQDYGVTNLDAKRIGQAIVGAIVLDTLAYLAGDVDRNGRLTGGDASIVNLRSIGTLFHYPLKEEKDTSDFLFYRQETLEAIDWSTVNAFNIPVLSQCEDFSGMEPDSCQNVNTDVIAILKGDVTQNYDPMTMILGKKSQGLAEVLKINLDGLITGNKPNEFKIPVEYTADWEIEAIDFNLKYNIQKLAAVGVEATDVGKAFGLSPALGEPQEGHIYIGAYANNMITPTTEPLFYLVFETQSNTFEPTDFNDIKVYLDEILHEGTVSENVVTDINPHILANFSLNLYPNPASKNVVIRHTALETTAEITFYNILGEKVKSIPVASQDTQHNIDLGEFPKGIYLTKLSHNGFNIATDKLIVE